MPPDLGARRAPAAVQHPLLGQAPPQVDLKGIIGARRAPAAVQHPLLGQAPPQVD